MGFIRRCAATAAFVCAFTATAMADTPLSLAVPVLAAAPNLTGSVDSSWANAAKATLDYDFTYQRASADATTAYVAQDDRALYVAFVATQRAALTDAQETNGAGVLQDDNVAIVLYPLGVNGISYAFYANPRGARYQTSSENSAYAPQWSATGTRTPDGYVVTMRIPFDVMRAGGSHAWKAQLVRQTISTGGVAVWEHTPGQRQPKDPAYAGTLDDMEAAVPKSATRPKPRVQLYALGEAATAAYGGNTSRVGADLALPVTATSSFVAALHPDYSNVEVDQQTISPTAFARQYSEVRPFFTQGSGSFNEHLSCTNCPTTLYTPSIPSFREGFAYEGTQGPVSFAAFDAIGKQRSDAAQTANWSLTNTKDAYQFDAQRVSVDTPWVHDDASTFSGGYLNQRTHYFAYLNYGEDRGSLVTDPGAADYLEWGGGYVTQTTTVALTLQKIGSQFDPLDGYVSQNDISGYFAAVNRTLNFSPVAPLHDIALQTFSGRFHNAADRLAQAQNGYQVNFDFRNLLSLHVFQNAIGVRGYDGELLPYDSDGFYLGYNVNSTTPSSITYVGGPYYHGHLTSWSYLTTRPLRRRLNLSLEVDENLYGDQLPPEPAAKQWLQRASLDWQFSRDASFDAGFRRIVGRNLPNSYQAPDLPTTQAPLGEINGYAPFDYVDAGNVSLAFHFLAARNEFYLVYGSPNSLATTPALIFKWIRYIGAEKGT